MLYHLTMAANMKYPLDATKYPPDPRHLPIQPGTSDGRYVYVQDELATIWIVPDNVPHLHPKVLGYGLPAKYAGDLTIKNGRIVDVTNCSGTFQFDDAGDCDESWNCCVSKAGKSCREASDCSRTLKRFAPWYWNKI
jgi:hypothetical protein